MLKLMVKLDDRRPGSNYMDVVICGPGVLDTYRGSISCVNFCVISETHPIYDDQSVWQGRYR